VRHEYWVDVLHWGGKDYRPLRAGNSESDVPLGGQIGIVTCNIEALAALQERDREVTGPLLQGNATYLPVGTKLYQVPGYRQGCRIEVVVGGTVGQYLASRPGVDKPSRCATDGGESNGP